MIQLENIKKVYKTKEKIEVNALDNINVIFPNKGLVFILGPSGSGKSTLLNVIGGLDEPTNGKVIIEDNQILGKDITYEQYRQNYIGFVFQEYNLLDDFNVFDNICLSISYNKNSRKNVVETVLNKVNLSGYCKRRIRELSGGQKQRIAIARALAKNSKILLCDEPTGNLDSNTSKEIFDLLWEISKEKLVIIVSHNEEMSKQYADRIIEIKDGSIIRDDIKKTEENTTNNNSSQVINRVSFGYKIKCSFNNLVSHKFKTLISFLLLFLSIFAMCLMQICLTYNSEKTIVKNIKQQDTIVVLKNNSQNGGVSNSRQTYPITDEVSNNIDKKVYADGYYLNYATAFLLNEDNIGLIEKKKFYFKESIYDNTAYVTDYFINIVMKDSNFSSITFGEYEELLGKEVIYKGNVLFTISGVIKTDYKNYYDERGNLKEKNENYQNDLIYDRNVYFRQKYIYEAIYMLESTFDSLYVDNASISFSNLDGVIIKGIEEGYSINLDYFRISNIQSENPSFFMTNGKFGVCNKDESKEDSTEERILSSDEIVISGDLYNRIFGENIYWEEFYRQYSVGILQGEPKENALKYLNKVVSFEIDDGINKYEIKNKKIVGVSTSYSIGKDNNFVVYGNKEDVVLNNKMLTRHYVSELNVDLISNLYKTIKELRDDSILVAGPMAASSYEKEYIIQNMAYFFIAVTIVVSIIAVISIFNLVNTKIRDKKREIGILVAIGLKKKEINFIFLFSILFMIVISSILTLGASNVLVYIFNKILTERPFEYISYFNIGWLIYISIIICGMLLLFISLIPLNNFTKRKPIEIIKS